MPLTVDYLPIATGVGANVDSQANFAGSTYQTEGFQSGLSKSAQFNKAWRQPSMIGSAVAWFIANTLNINVVDDGNLTNLITNLTNAILAAAAGPTKLVSVPYSATPIFNAALGSAFEITLTGNVTSSTITGISPGQRLKLIVKQDATGGRTFVPPSMVPMSPISTTANITNIQNFFVDLSSSIYQDGPLSAQ